MSNSLMSLKTAKSSRTIQIASVSSSGFFLKGIGNILRDEDCLNIAYTTSSAKAVGKCLVKLRPDFLLLDKTIKISFIKLLNLITEKSRDTRVIVFNSDENWRPVSQSKNNVNSSNIICLAKERNSSELIQIIKNQTAVSQQERLHAKASKIIDSQKES